MSQEEAEKKKANMTEAETKEVSNKEVIERIQAKNVDIGSTTFKVEIREIDEKDANAGDTTASGANSFIQKVNFGDGKVGVLNIILTPIEQAMSLNTNDLDDKKEAAIKKKAENSKTKKEDREAERDK